MRKIQVITLVLGTLLTAVAWGDEARLTWLGHAAFQYVTRGGKVVLIDPWLTNPKAPKGYAPAKVDLILVTHGHFDHVADAFALAKKHGATLIASYELTEIAKSKGVKNVQPLNPQGSATVAGVTVTAVNAVHSSGFQDGKNLIYAGAPLGFVLAESDSPVIYHAGDTGVFGDMAQIAQAYHPDVALLPIGGVFTMKPVEAASAAKLLRSKTIVPMHFGTFPALTGTPAELKAEMEKASAPGHVQELTPGTEMKMKDLL